MSDMDSVIISPDPDESKKLSSESGQGVELSPLPNGHCLDSSDLSTLSSGLKALHLKADEEALLAYLHLLHKWNKTYNLTGIKDLNSMIHRHLLDSLAIVPWITGRRLLDVGTGAGLPGIPLALYLPKLPVVLLDSNGKKTRFLEEVKRSLKIDNIEIVKARVENYKPLVKFDMIISRALAKVHTFLTLTHALMDTNGVWLAMKAMPDDNELAQINLPYEVKTYEIPGIAIKRTCLIIKNIPQS